MKIVNVWTYTSGGDDHSRGSIAGVCSSESFARGAAKGKGWYGGDGAVETRQAIEVEGKFYLLSKEIPHPIDLDGRQAVKDEQLKQVALAKLSDEEKKLLGLK